MELIRQAFGRERRLVRAEMKNFLDYHGKHLHYTYVRRYSDDVRNPQPLLHGGATLAWEMPKNWGNVVHVAVSWCSTDDRFDALLGRYAATAAHTGGRIVPIRLPQRGHYSVQLRAFFQHAWDSMEIIQSAKAQER